MPKILIVGAGVTGLTTAFELEKRGYRDITLIESSERIGGKLETIVDDGLTIELGPDAVFTRKPEALELVKELGLEHEIIYPRANTFNMLIDGRLHDVPAGLLSFGTLTESHLDSVSFLSSEAKLAVLNEHNVPAGPAEDETIASFFRRRFGTEYSRLIAEPLLAGTHAGAGERLSMMALYPAYKQAEQKCGSLSGMPKQIATEGSKPTFFSLRSGLGSLPQELTKRLKFTTVRLNHSIARMNHDGRWHFTYEDGTVEAADAVVLAIPAPAASHLLSNTDRGAAELLNGIPHGSATIATMAFMSSQWPTPLEGTGFLVPDLPNQIITGGTWSSNKWPSRSADDETLVRLFLNGVHTDEAEVFEHVADFFDSAFGSCPVPTYMKLTTWENGLPQYVLGHLDLVAQIEERFEPQCLFPTGTSYRGVGIPDSIRQGRATAVKIANKFQI